MNGRIKFPRVLEEKIEPPGTLLESLCVEAIHVGENKFDYLVEIESEELVKKENLIL